MQKEVRFAVAAIRVSTAKQGMDGDSPEDQLRQMQLFARANNIVIVKTFEYHESGSKLKQPMQHAIDYVKSGVNGQIISVFLIKSIDRLTRAGSEIYSNLKRQLSDCDVTLTDLYGIIGRHQVNTLEHLNVEYNWSKFSPTHKSEILEAERAKDEIRDIMTRMIGAQIRYARMGYWVRRPLYGFDNQHIETTDGKRCVLKPNTKEAQFVKRMFEMRARGTFDDREIVDTINKLGYKSRVRTVRDRQDRTKVVREVGGEPLSLKVLWSILENPVYAGINPEKWTQDKPVRCKFKGLVSLELFNSANAGKIHIVDEKGEIKITRRKPAEHLLRKGSRSNDFPYKRVVMCTHCSKPLFGSASRGKLGKYYPAYHCNSRGHYFRVPKKQFDETITKFVKDIRISPEYVEALTSAVLTEWERRQSEVYSDNSTIDQRIKDLRLQCEAIVGKIKFLTSEISIKYMEEELLKNEAEIAKLEEEKRQIDAESLNIKKVLANVKYFLEHLDELLLLQSNPMAKAELFGVIFDKLPTYEDLLSGTQKEEPIISVNRLFRKQNPANDLYGWG